jgi:hypothetical protein
VCCLPARSLSHDTLEWYRQELRGWSDQRARQLIAASEVVAGNVEPGTVVPIPTTERQARELAKVERLRTGGVPLAGWRRSAYPAESV